MKKLYLQLLPECQVITAKFSSPGTGGKLVRKMIGILSIATTRTTIRRPLRIALVKDSNILKECSRSGKMIGTQPVEMHLMMSITENVRNKEKTVQLKLILLVPWNNRVILELFKMIFPMLLA